MFVVCDVVDSGFSVEKKSDGRRNKYGSEPDEELVDSFKSSIYAQSFFYALTKSVLIEEREIHQRERERS